MKKVLLLAVFALAVTTAYAQQAVINQSGGNQTATITQTGSVNEAYVDQFSNNGGQNTALVEQTGASNYANVDQDETGGGGNTPGTFATIQQVGDDNGMWQTANSPGYNSGQTMKALQQGNDNIGVQTIASGYTERLTLDQTGHQNNSDQYMAGGGHNYGDVFQWGDRNVSKQEITGTNEGSGADNVLVKQVGNDNQAQQVAAGGGFSQNNNAEIFQNGHGNYANQSGWGTEFFQRITQDGDANSAVTSATGHNNYMNIRMADGGVLQAAQLGDNNSVTGAGGPGTEGLMLNGATAQIAQTGDLNSLVLNMNAGGNAVVTQLGDANVA
ncbi:MAG TPA: hypothetical protein VF190_10560, partial [Rhodothermales bacterium]